MRSAKGSRPIVAHHRIRESRGERRWERPVGVSSLSKCITRLAQHRATPHRDVCVILFSFRFAFLVRSRCPRVATPSVFLTSALIQFMADACSYFHVITFKPAVGEQLSQFSPGSQVHTFANKTEIFESIDFLWR